MFTVLLSSNRWCNVACLLFVTDRDVLRKYGNMSSGSLIFVLNEIRKQRERRNQAYSPESPQCWVPSLAFGPGLNVEGALLKALF